jgi:group I intron endonuclease
MYTVYKHTNKINGKVYIGITSKENPNDRWHNGKGYYQNRYFDNAIKKYGWDNFCHDILFSGLSKGEAEDKEIELIASYKSADRKYGYNISLGGNSYGKHTEESKRLMSERQKASFTEERRNKIRISNKDRVWSDAQRKQKSIKTSGENNPMYGVHRYGGSNPRAKKVVCNGIVFNSAKECAVHFDVNYGAFMSWLNGKRKMRKDFKTMNLRYYSN